METKDEPGSAGADGERDAENLALNMLKFLGLGIAGLLVLVWLISAYMAFISNKERLTKLKPALAEAQTLSPEFGAVLAEPAKYADKAVLWCVQNMSEQEVYYRRDMKSCLRVLNYKDMPLVTGGKHQYCSDMLLKIKGARHLSAGGGIVDVQFVAVP
ncbi:MAG TPA: hypothetical protein PKI19_04145 [Elusimicrobiales bacterium]|nr:hypothetical protein [Elusimicrobiales bacterium]